jgi:hypothetical protein
LSQKKLHRKIKAKIHCGKSLNFKSKEKYYSYLIKEGGGKAFKRGIKECDLRLIQSNTHSYVKVKQSTEFPRKEKVFTIILESYN